MKRRSSLLIRDDDSLLIVKPALFAAGVGLCVLNFSMLGRVGCAVVQALGHLFLN